MTLISPAVFASFEENYIDSKYMCISTKNTCYKNIFFNQSFSITQSHNNTLYFICLESSAVQSISLIKHNIDDSKYLIPFNTKDIEETYNITQ